MIKVVQWNCRGLRLRAAELNARFHARSQDRPDVLLMQETNTTLTCIRGYAVYSTPTITDKKGGAPGKSTIFISHACPHHQIDLSRWCNDEQEVVAIRTEIEKKAIMCRPIIDRTGKRNLRISGTAGLPICIRHIQKIKSYTAGILTFST